MSAEAMLQFLSAVGGRLVDGAHQFVATLDQAILVYYVFINSVYALLLVLAIFEIFARNRETEIEDSSFVSDETVLIPISIISPAFNEEKTIVESVTAMLRLRYPDHEVVVVNDGSKDRTLERLKESFQLFPVAPAVRQPLKCKTVKQYYRSLTESRLLVVDKANGGKADSLNAGINACRTPIFLACDADTIMEEESLTRLVRPFLTTSDIVATGGTIGVVNDCVIENGSVTRVRFPRGFLPAVQTVEYFRAFFLGRLGWNRLGGNLVISGAFGLFDREAVIEAGGYATDTVGEDMELVVRLHRVGIEKGKPRKVRFIPDPVAWTEVPASAAVLGRQRERWHRGLIQTLWKHRVMFLNPRYGLIGLVAFPFFTLGELFAPIVEAVGLVGLVLGIALGAINPGFILAFFTAAWGLLIFVSLASILIEQIMYRKYKDPGDLLRMIAFAFLENAGYRQLTVFWRLQAFWNYLRGSQSWGKMERQGFGRPAPVVPIRKAS